MRVVGEHHLVMTTEKPDGKKMHVIPAFKRRH